MKEVVAFHIIVALCLSQTIRAFSNVGVGGHAVHLEKTTRTAGFLVPPPVQQCKLPLSLPPPTVTLQNSGLGCSSSRHFNQNRKFIPAREVKVAASSSSAVESGGSDGGLGKGFLGSLDIPLLSYFALWYIGNYLVSSKVEYKNIDHCCS